MNLNYIKKSDGVIFLGSRHSYRFLEVGILICGFRPHPSFNLNHRRMYMLLTIYSMVIVSIYLPIALVVPHLINYDSSKAGDLIKSLTVSTNGPGSFVKVSLVMVNVWRMTKTKDILDIMDKRCVTLEERLQVHGLVNRCNLAYLIYAVVYVSSPIASFLNKVPRGSAPYSLYNPLIDWRENSLNFWIISIIECILVAAAFHLEAVVDSIPLIFAMTVRQHLKCLNGRIERLRNDPNSSVNENYEELVQCIKDHKLILEYCEHMRPWISRTLFVHLGTVSLVFATSLVYLFVFADLFSGIAVGLYLTAVMIQSFPFVYACEQIIEDCDNLPTTLFHSNWIDADRRYKATLIQFMHNTQQPIEFFGGGFFPIRLITNIRVAKLGFSLITYIKQMEIF